MVATNLQPILMLYLFFFATCFALLVADDDTIVLLTTPIATEKGPTRKNSLRGRAVAFLEMNGVVTGTENIAVRLKRSKKGMTKLGLAVELNLGGHVSAAAKLEFIKRRLDEAGKLSVYFHRLVSMEGLIEEVRFLRSETRDVRACFRY